MNPKKTDNETLCYVQGPYEGGPLEPDMVYASFLSLRQEHGKNDGRQYFHTVLSFPPQENLTPEEALEYGIKFCEERYSGYQTCIAVHNEEGKQTHIHFVINSVGMDGKKFELNRSKLKADKEYNDKLCKEYGLIQVQKGYHADGTAMSEGTIISYDQNKYRAIINSDGKKPSYLCDCAIAITQVMRIAKSKEEFETLMKKQGYSVLWSDNRKHITFIDRNGKKVRDSNLQKTFNLPISKEVLLNEFTRKNTEQSARTRTQRTDDAHNGNSETENRNKEPKRSHRGKRQRR